MSKINLLNSFGLRCTLTAGFFLASFAGISSAAGEKVNVNVPFTFELNGRELPAGDYTISEQGPTGIVYLRTANTVAVTLSVPADGDSKLESGLVFESLNGKKRLIGVQIESEGARAIPAHAASR